MSCGSFECAIDFVNRLNCQIRLRAFQAIQALCCLCFSLFTTSLTTFSSTQTQRAKAIEIK